MYLFSAIKDVFMSGRRSSVTADDRRQSETGGMRRTVSEAHMYQPQSTIETDRDGGLGSKSKRVESPEHVVPVDSIPKRRRTTFGGDRELLGGRISLDRTEAPAFTSMTRLPSPMPRQSLPGPVMTRRRDSLYGSPSMRPQTPTHQPKFVDLSRREPSQQRALDSARTILDTLDRVTAGPSTGLGGSSRKYKPPQPLRPMRFKSLSSSRPVSLFDMLSGSNVAPPTPQAPSVPSSPAVQSKPEPVAATEKLMPNLTLPIQARESPRSIFGSNGSTAAAASKPVVGSIFGATTAAHAGSPSMRGRIGSGSSPSMRASSPLMKSIGKLPSPLKKPLPVAPVRHPSPLKRVTVETAPAAPPAAAPAKGGFVWGDPSKVSASDFIDDDGFAPGADDSSSSESEKEDQKSVNVSSIFGGNGNSSSFLGPSSPAPPANGSSSLTLGGTANIFGGGDVKTIFAPQPATSSIFGPTAIAAKPVEQSTASAAAQPFVFGTGAAAPKPAEQPSIFGTSSAAAPKPADQPSIFGTGAAAPKPTEQPSIFGTSLAAPKPAEQSSIFGTSSAAPKPAEQSSIFSGAAASKPAEFPSIFGTTTTTKPAEPATSAATNMFGTTTTTKPAEPAAGGSIFGGSTLKAPEPALSTNLFGPTTTPAQPMFGSTSAPAEALPAFGQTSTTTPAATSSIFGTASTAGIFGATSTPSEAAKPAANSFGQSTSIFGQAKPETASAFGTTSAAQPTGSSVFGTTTASQPAASSAFGTTTAAQPASGMFVFGTPAATPPASPHAPAKTLTAQPTFGAQQPLFGTSSVPQPTGSNIFGTTAPSGPTTPSGGFFGSTGGAVQSGPFGGAFGSAPADQSASSAFSFAQPSAAAQPSVFGSGSSNVFGGSQQPSPFGSSGPTANNMFGQQQGIFGANTSGFTSGIQSPAPPAGDNPFAMGESNDEANRGAAKRRIVRARR